MIVTEDYYNINTRHPANSKEFFAESPSIFPLEGLCVGEYVSECGYKAPALIPIHKTHGICFLSRTDNVAIVKQNMQMMALRLALSIPSGSCRFMLFDSTGMGQGLIYLTKLVEQIKGAHILTSIEELKRALGSILNEIRDTIQNVLVDDYANKTLVEYNLDKDANHPYRFIVITDFPKGIDSQTGNLLLQILENGPRAGVYVIMNFDSSLDVKDDFNFTPKSVLDKMTTIYEANGKYRIHNIQDEDFLSNFALHLDTEFPDSNSISQIQTKINQNYADYLERKEESRKIGVIKPNYKALYANPYDDNTQEIKIEIGLDYSSKHAVSLKFNSSEYVHAFILGQSGSGKSVLLNNIISSAILKYSPRDLVFYLLDFKGVEFNRYKGEKHTKAVLVDNSDPQMTLEVLRELRDEDNRRRKLWQAEGVANIDGYNKKHPENKEPQVLFVADECQVMFQVPRISGLQSEIHREITAILNTIATQGRSQGIHMLLATQQLDDTDISGQVIKNLTECLLLMSAPSDSNRLVPDSGEMTARQATGIVCYYHKKVFQSQTQTYFATDEELLDVIDKAKNKAEDFPGNGEAYFCGSAMFKLSKSDLDLPKNAKYPTALLGKNIGLRASNTTIYLKEDYLENVLFFGANKQDQTIGVMMNALISLIISCKSIGNNSEFLIIDCLSKAESGYKRLLSKLESDGLCHLIERQKSAHTFRAIAEDIKNGSVSPVVLAILGCERFVEMKRNQKLEVADISKKQEIGGIEPLSFSNPYEKNSSDIDEMTFQKVFTYILDEGPIHGVHVLLQVDKPSNILFEGEYGINATDKFKHKVILRSENKFLTPMRFSKGIDVEVLSDEEEHLRAYYYPEGDDPILFTPFLLPDEEILQ